MESAIRLIVGGALQMRLLMSVAFSAGTVLDFIRQFGQYIFRAGIDNNGKHTSDTLTIYLEIYYVHLQSGRYAVFRYATPGVSISSSLSVTADKHT